MGSNKPISETDEGEIRDPKWPPTRVPKLHKMVKDRLSKEAVKLDKSLARLQVLFLDAVGPLASILEKGDKGKERRNQTIAEMNFKLGAWNVCHPLGEELEGVDCKILVPTRPAVLSMQGSQLLFLFLCFLDKQINEEHRSGFLIYQVLRSP